MKFSLVFVALFATALANPFDFFRQEERKEGKGGDVFDDKKIQRIEKEIDQEIEVGEELAGEIAGKRHKKQGDISICALELLENVGHAFDGAFEERGGKDGGREGGHKGGEGGSGGKGGSGGEEGEGGEGGEGGEEGEGGKGGEGEGNIAEEIGNAILRRMLRFKRSLQFDSFDPSTPKPTEDIGGTRGPSERTTWHPYEHTTRGRRECRGALEIFFNCVRNLDLGDEHEGGHHGGHGQEGSTAGHHSRPSPTPSVFYKRKMRKH